MLEDRRLAVLRAIVEDYVATQEPVGSKALVERHSLGVSSATIRNDMAALEEEGYIAQPHTSAGRIPTDLGYRAFVDRLAAVKPLSPAERKAISSFLDGAVDLDDVMARSVRLLAQVTRQVALVQYPSLVRSAVLHLELVQLSSTRVLLVLIADTGRVEQRVIDLPAPVGEGFVSGFRARLVGLVAGRNCAELAIALEGFVDSLPAEDRPAAAAIVATLLEVTLDTEEQRIMLGGTANLARYRDTFATRLEPILEALEEQVILLRLLGEVSAAPEVKVRIGHENELADLQETSIITTGYGRGSSVVAGVGVIGPTHMDYPAHMATVRAVAQYLGRILDEN